MPRLAEARRAVKVHMPAVSRSRPRRRFGLAQKTFMAMMPIPLRTATGSASSSNPPVGHARRLHPTLALGHSGHRGVERHCVQSIMPFKGYFQDGRGGVAGDTDGSGDFLVAGVVQGLQDSVGLFNGGQVFRAKSWLWRDDAFLPPTLH